MTSDRPRIRLSWYGHQKDSLRASSWLSGSGLREGKGGRVEVATACLQATKRTELSVCVLKKQMTEGDCIQIVGS